MRILHFHFASLDGTGGTETVIAALAARQAAAGHRVAFAELGARAGQRFSPRLAVEVDCLPGAAWPSFRRPRSLAAALRLVALWLMVLVRRRPHVVHVHFPLGQALPILLTAPVLGLLGLMPRLVVTLHGPEVGLSHALDPALVPWQAALLGRADAVTIVADALRQVVAARHPGLSLPLTPIPNGVPAVERSADDAELPREPGLVLFAGRCSHEKGLDQLIAAWGLVRAALPGARLLVLGDGPERAAAMAMAAAMPEVIFAGTASLAEVRCWMRRADLLVLPSRFEALPMALLEAGACALPVVATRVGDVAAVIEPQVSGELVSANDPEALAAAVIAFLRRPALARRRAGLALQQRVQGAYSETAMADAYGALYLRLLQRG